MNQTDECHPIARGLLAQAPAAGDPAGSFAWMEQSLPESSRQELYRPFFQDPVGQDPATAAGLLCHFPPDALL